MIAHSNIFTLHRYYIWANRMRTHFDEVLKKSSENKITNDQFEIESRLYMSYWYGGLYVVIEGWKRLKLVDVAVDQLLESRNVGLLKRYRHGVFHFQPKYNDKKFLDFIVEGENCVEWIRQLNQEFGRFFLQWFNSNKK